MQLRHKIAALSILPLLLAVAVVCALVLFQNQRLGEQQAQLIESSSLMSRQAELKSYVEMDQGSGLRRGRGETATDPMDIK